MLMGRFVSSPRVEEVCVNSREETTYVHVEDRPDRKRFLKHAFQGGPIGVRAHAKTNGQPTDLQLSYKPLRAIIHRLVQVDDHKARARSPEQHTAAAIAP